MAASQNPHDDIESVLITEAAIDARVRELGAEIGAAYAGNESLILVSVLKGSIVFVADLMRAIPGNVQIDLMEVSSYDGGKSTECGARCTARLVDARCPWCAPNGRERL